jgi:dihydrofolate reductase
VRANFRGISPEDLKFFKRTTLGHPILMGRATFDSIGRPLPGRQNIVLSTTMAPREGVTVIRSVAELSSVCAEAETVFVIGGARVFEDLLPQCDGLYLTWVSEPYEGDEICHLRRHPRQPGSPPDRALGRA